MNDRHRRDIETMVKNLEFVQRTIHENVQRVQNILVLEYPDDEADDDVKADSASMDGNLCEANERIDNIINVFKKVSK